MKNKIKIKLYNYKKSEKEKEKEIKMYYTICIKDGNRITDEINTIFFVSKNETLTQALLEYLNNMDDESKIKRSLLLGTVKKNGVFKILSLETVPYLHYSHDFIYIEGLINNYVTHDQDFYTFYHNAYWSKKELTAIRETFGPII